MWKLGNIDLSSLFKSSFFKIGVMTVIAIICLGCLTSYGIKLYLVNTYDKKIEDKLKFIYKNETLTHLETLCAVANCSYMIVKKRDKITYYTRNHDYRYTLTLEKNIGALDEVEINKNNPRKFIIHNITIYGKFLDFQSIEEKVVDYFITIVSILCLFIYITISLIFFISKNKRNRELRENLEAHIQKNLTETLHHEIGNPTQGIWNVFLDFASNKYPCYILNNFKDVGAENCQVCNGKNHLIPDEDSKDAMRLIRIEYDRITSVLNILSKSKYIKYTGKETSIGEILDITAKAKELFNNDTIKITIHKQNILNEYRLSNGLENGLFINIINSMLTNSREANANEVEIDAHLEGDTLLLDLKDNGHGVIDKHNHLVKDDVIFRYGYSSKDDNYEPTADGIVNKIKNFFLVTEQKSVRGFGLSYNRDILKMHGGTLGLVYNSNKGATFRMSVKVKHLKALTKE